MGLLKWRQYTKPVSEACWGSARYYSLPVSFSAGIVMLRWQFTAAGEFFLPAEKSNKMKYIACDLTVNSCIEKIV